MSGTPFKARDYSRDGVLNDNDLFPYDGSDWADLDGDGVDNAGFEHRRRWC